MSIRNIWALEPDECLVAEKLQARIANCEVYFPVRDSGTDILVAKGAKLARVQVKGSRYYTKKKGEVLPREVWHSWHQVFEKKLGTQNGADFYVFLTYISKFGENKVTEFEEKYLIVPAIEMERRVKAKQSGKNKVYRFYFRFEGPEVFDIRGRKYSKDGPMDYSKFLENWKQIEIFLS